MEQHGSGGSEGRRKKEAGRKRPVSLLVGASAAAAAASQGAGKGGSLQDGNYWFSLSGICLCLLALLLLSASPSLRSPSLARLEPDHVGRASPPNLLSFFGGRLAGVHWCIACCLILCMPVPVPVPASVTVAVPDAAAVLVLPSSSSSASRDW